MISKFLGWKGWAIAGGFILTALLLLKYRGDIHKARAEALQARVASVEKVSGHQAHVGKAAQKAAETTPQKADKAVQDSRSDNNLDRFRWFD